MHKIKIIRIFSVFGGPPCTQTAVVISPSALLFNFVAGLVQYGLDKNDNRYSFYTYEKYARNQKIAKDALLIVDEAHNFRTEIKTNEIKDPDYRNYSSNK